MHNMENTHINSQLMSVWGVPVGSVVKNSLANAWDTGSIPGSGRSPGEGNSNPLMNCEGFRNHANVILGEKLVNASGGKFDHMNEKVNKFYTAYCGGSQIR